MEMRMDLLRKLVREEIRMLMKDDALFGHSDSPGIVPDWDSLEDKSLSSSCPVCGTAHDGPCHNPSLGTDAEDGRNLSYGHSKSTDQEGRTTRKQLYYIAKKAQSLHDIIRDDDDLPEWVQSKIARVADKINAAYEYVEYRIDNPKKS